MTARTHVDKRRQALLAGVALVVILLVLGVTWLLNRGTDTNDSTSAPARASSSQSATPGGSDRTTARVDDHVARTLALIDAGRWPAAANAPGTKGGITFGNREGNLPARTAAGKRITYREWDVNPKRPGRGRDAERIVTGSDGSAWYTDDHYRTFVQIRGPSR